MFDRMLMPTLTFTLLTAALGAFVADALQSRQAVPVVQLERVVITATRELPGTPLALAETASVKVAVR